MPENGIPKESNKIVDFAGKLTLEKSRLHMNVEQDFVMTTADKLHRSLTTHLSRIEQRRAWITPLGILVAILIALLTSDFRKAIFSASVWESIFIICAALSFIWFTRAVWKAGDSSLAGLFRFVFLGHRPSIDDVVRDITSGAMVTDTSAASGPLTPTDSEAVFYDCFDSMEGWEIYGIGKLSLSGEFQHTGKFSLKKDFAGDPNGGFKLIGIEINPGCVFSGWIYRPHLKTDAAADRLALENHESNGYGFCIAHNTNETWLELRVKGKKKAVGEKLPFTAPVAQWYRFELYVRVSGELELQVSDSLGKVLHKNSAVVSLQYGGLDRVAIHGGYPYYIDELRVERL